MRFHIIPAVLILAASGFAFQTAPRPDPATEHLEKLKAHADRMKEPDRARIYSEIAQQLADIANQQFINGENHKGQATIQEALSYADKCVSVAGEKRKKLKHSEINLRETERKIDEIRRSLDLDDQPPLKAASKHIEDLRAKLLQLMFGDDKK